MRNVPNSNYTVYVTATVEKIVLETGNQNSFEQLKDVCGDISVKPGRICLDPEGRENHSPTPIKYTGGRTWKLNPEHIHWHVKGNELLINKTGTWNYCLPPICGEDFPNQSVARCESNFYQRENYPEKGDVLVKGQCSELFLGEVKPQGKKTFQFQQKHETGRLTFWVHFKIDTQTFHQIPKQNKS